MNVTEVGASPQGGTFEESISLPDNELISLLAKQRFANFGLQKPGPKHQINVATESLRYTLHCMIKFPSTKEAGKKLSSVCMNLMVPGVLPASHCQHCFSSHIPMQQSYVDWTLHLTQVPESLH